MKLVEDLGEETFPEPKDATAAVTDTSASTSTSASSTLTDTASVTSDASSSTSTLVNDDGTSSSTSSSPIVNSQEPLVGQAAEETTDRTKIVTTRERQPMTIPETVHISITPENLKDYVGPPTYQRDRMYTTPPPPGVSTGLGYLGNGSGAVMPVEAMVCIAHTHYS